MRYLLKSVATVCEDVERSRDSEEKKQTLTVDKSDEQLEIPS